MTLLEGLATRVTKNPETCRSQMVPHAGKSEVQLLMPAEVEGRLGSNATWAGIADSLVAAVDTRVRTGQSETFTPSFSTTTPARRMAIRLKKLEVFSPYFEYRAMAACGIPWIELEGTPDDWRKVRSNLHSLGLCGLSDWANRMDAVLEEFVRTSEGRPTRSFWRGFVQFHTVWPMCGVYPWIDGWITTFFPVDRDGKIRPFLSPLQLEDVPPDRGEFDFSIRFLGGRTRKFSLVSGFTGVGQSSDGSLFPELGWSAWETTTGTP